MLSIQSETKTRKVFKGTIARTAIQCDYPNGKTGTFIFTGEDHRNPDAIVSPLFPSVYEMVKWANANNWTSYAGPYVFDGETTEFTLNY